MPRSSEEWEAQPFTDSMLLDCIGRQAAKHTATRQHFSQVLDQLDADVRGGDASMRVWSQWALLARKLKLDDRIVQLYVERRTPAGTIRPYVDMNPIVLDTLIDALVERKQLADAGRCSSTRPSPSRDSTSRCR